MNWAALLKALLLAAASFALWLRDRGALDAAEAELLARHLKGTLDEIEKARAARSAMAGDLERYPERLRDDDGFKRGA